MKQESDKMAEAHAELSSQLTLAAQRMSEFITRQKNEIKVVSYKFFLLSSVA